MRVLVTGGAGYIGSHTVLSLTEQGHEAVVLDNLSNSSIESLRRVEKLTGASIEFHQLDVCDSNSLRKILIDAPVDAAIHFAGFKAVGESVEQPLLYYRNNLDSTISLAECLLETSTKAKSPRIIFSSSATVYGTPSTLPISEDAPTGTGITNPYGQTKYMCERILEDVCLARPDMQAIALRYFNPIGSHPSGVIGEDPSQIPNNLAPYITQVAVGRRARLGIFGNDYPTRDGTGIRDYIHVMDLAEGHVAALGFTKPGFHAINLGTGSGTSVFELHKAFEIASGKEIPFEILPRRSGDIPECYASTLRASSLLNWSAYRTINEACEDSWRWQARNPDGYSRD